MDKLLSFLMGVVLTMILSLTIPLRSVYNIEVFERDGIPNVIRLSQAGMDSIYVEDVNNNFSFTLGEYLDTIPDKAKRGNEEGRIKTLVGWYE